MADNSAFVATGALSSTLRLSTLISERDYRSSRGAENYFTTTQDFKPLPTDVVDLLSHNSITQNYLSCNSNIQDELQSIQQSASAVVTQNSHDKPSKYTFV